MKIICLGDSFTQGYLLEKSYVDYLSDYGYETINWGRNGDTTSDILYRFREKECDLLILFAGTNDLYQGISAEEAFENIKKILKKSKADKNLIIIPPLIEEEESYQIYEMINKAINDFASMIQKLDYPTVDARKVEASYFLDGLHMREDFHKRLADEIIKTIENI